MAQRKPELAINDYLKPMKVLFAEYFVTDSRKLVHFVYLLLNMYVVYTQSVLVMINSGQCHRSSNKFLIYFESNSKRFHENKTDQIEIQLNPTKLKNKKKLYLK